MFPCIQKGTLWGSFFIVFKPCFVYIIGKRTSWKGYGVDMVKRNLPIGIEFYKKVIDEYDVTSLYSKSGINIMRMIMTNINSRQVDIR